MIAVVVPWPTSPAPEMSQTAMAILASLLFLMLYAHRLGRDDRIAPPRLPSVRLPPSALDPSKQTAVLLIAGYDRAGLNALVALCRLGTFPQVLLLGPFRRALEGYRFATQTMDLSAGVEVEEDPSHLERHCLRIAESHRAVVFCSATDDPVLKKLRRRGFATLSLSPSSRRS